MSNQFLRASQEAIARNGVLVTYKKKGASTYDPSSGAVVSTDLDYSVLSYPKHIRASQFHYPDLIGKESYMFYIAGEQSFVPAVADSILFDSFQYKVDSIQKHFAGGVTCLYRIIAVKG